MVMDFEKMRKHIESNEGRHNKPYKCSEGKLTIGVGHNIEDRGLSDKVIDLLFIEDIQEAYLTAHSLFYRFVSMPQNAQTVFMDMAFQLGKSRLRKFKNMIACANERDWKGVVLEMVDSRWYHQTPNRAKRNIKLIEGLIDD